MPIVRDIRLHIDPVDVLRQQAGQRQGNVNPSLKSLVEELHSQVADQNLIQPEVAFELFPIDAVRDNRVILESGAVLEGRRLAIHFGSAKMVAGVMCTLGPRLDDRVSAFHGEDNELESMLLDGIGTLAVNALGAEACHQVKDRAESDGLQASGPLSPGLFGLPMENQTVLHRLVQGERIGITLTPGLMMIPNKSLSMIIGIGESMETWEKAEACSWCNMKHHCTFRVPEA